MPNDLETKTYKAFLSWRGLIHLFIQAFPEPGVIDMVGVMEGPHRWCLGYCVLGQCLLAQSCAEGGTFSFEGFVQPYEKRNPGKSSNFQATLGAQVWRLHSVSSISSCPLLPHQHCPCLLISKTKAEILPYHHPPRHHPGTFRKEREGQLPEFQGNMLYRAFHLATRSGKNLGPCAHRLTAGRLTGIENRVGDPINKQERESKICDCFCSVMKWRDLYWKLCIHRDFFLWNAIWVLEVLRLGADRGKIGGEASSTWGAPPCIAAGPPLGHYAGRLNLTTPLSCEVGIIIIFSRWGNTVSEKLSLFILLPAVLWRIWGS